MGGLLTLPFKFCSSINYLTRKGFTFALSYLTYRIYFLFFYIFKKRRFDNYDYNLVKDPWKNSFFIPELEWSAESPSKYHQDLTQKCDDAFYFGVNSSSEALAIHVSFRSNEQVQCSFVLRLSDGRVFSLPKEHVLQKKTNEEYTFGSSRIKLQCLLPMRKWRIFFNGLLKEHQKGDDISCYKHVKLAFICTASSEIFDFSSDMDRSLLAEYASETNDWNCQPQAFREWVKNVFNSYEQPGMLLGVVNVDGEPEKEMYLWGTRGRYLGGSRNLNNSSFHEIYGNFENGAVLHLGTLTFNNGKFLYGYLMRSDGFIHPVEEMEEQYPNDQAIQMRLKFFCGGVNHVCCIRKPSFDGLQFSKEFLGASHISYAEMSLNSHNGKGFILKGSNSGVSVSDKKPSKIEEASRRNGNPLSISFSDILSQDPSLTGGKGSSLAKLHDIAKNISPEYTVPQGIVVTTEAYKLFTRGELESDLQKFEKQVWKRLDNSTKELCEKMSEKINRAPLLKEIIESIESDLNIMMKCGDGVKFAVRSSATGEDTEQMSAAGQMKTILGLRSVDEILSALKECWASQFTFQAVGYKRYYGQPINTPMAVVIQEMVPCEIAGVAFTCDPVTGNPSYINITANYGLGESVVSASAEPDTVVFERDIHNQISFRNEQIGKKQSKIVMTGDSGTEEVTMAEQQSTQCCLSRELSSQIAHLAVMIENQYGSPRDLEWGIVGDKIFLFQARPVTSIDMDTDFEAKHCSDSYLRNEKEYLTTGNVGEVMPGATTPLSTDIFGKMMTLTEMRAFYNKEIMKTVPDVPYYSKRIIYMQGHAFFTMIDALLRTEQSDSNVMKAFMVALLGRMDVSDEALAIAKERHDAYGKSYKFNRTGFSIFVAVIFIRGMIRKLFSSSQKHITIDWPSHLSSEDMLHEIGKTVYRFSKAMQQHSGATVSSSLWNMVLLSMLSKVAGDWSSDVYSDFAYLLSTCTDVESADVPQAIQKLAHAIEKDDHSKEFKKMPFEEAFEWLQKSKSEVGEQFLKFLQKHGHRCLKEFDLHSQPWGTNPKRLVQVLQDLVGSDVEEGTDKKIPSFEEILSNMHIKLPFATQLKLRLILPSCRQAVRDRETSKSGIINMIHQFRRAFNLLADSMVAEGIIPSKDVIHFLFVEEIKQLIHSRSPRLVARAVKRQKLHVENEKLLFPEILSGVPKPINTLEKIDSSEKGFCMTGVPVSQGVSKATARVVTKLEDASNIEPGDILIAHSTDIGWSPYFPLLSGVVTELGGLISHGAVVAREYGLPCVVGVHGATRAFNSGDLVILDGNKGTLSRIDPE